MIVRLTTRQFNALNAALEDHAPRPLWLYFYERPRESAGKMIEISMIPDAWVDVKEVLLKLYEQRPLEKQRQASLLAAMTRIFRGCIHHVGHPAFAGQGMAEAQFEVLPGWQDFEGRPVRPLVPVPVWSHDEMARWKVLLIPEYHQEGQLYVTTWKAVPDGDVREWLEYDELVRRK